jgi:hypothetical protein
VCFFFARGEFLLYCICNPSYSYTVVCRVVACCLLLAAVYLTSQIHPSIHPSPFAFSITPTPTPNPSTVYSLQSTVYCLQYKQTSSPAPTQTQPNPNPNTPLKTKQPNPMIYLLVAEKLWQRGEGWSYFGCLKGKILKIRRLGGSERGPSNF